jgi:non-specific riboncleoside hydrolase
MNEKQIPVIIDCDPGIDDSFAIYYALNHPKLNVLALVSVAGNVPLSMTTSNACNLLHLLSSDIPVLEGSDGPLMGKAIEAKYAHGINGLGGYIFKEISEKNLVEGNAIDKIAEILESSKEPITIIAMGPLTNIAKLILTYPNLVKCLKDIVIMGGGITKGNYTSSAEFNIAADPMAAKIVIDAGLNVKLLPLDTTEFVSFNKTFMQDLKKADTLVSRTLYQIVDAKQGIETFEEDYPWFIHDMVAVVAVTHPELFDFSAVHVDVELNGTITKGQTVFDQRSFRKNEPNNTLVSTSKQEEIVNHCKEILTHE